LIATDSAKMRPLAVSLVIRLTSTRCVVLADSISSSRRQRISRLIHWRIDMAKAKKKAAKKVAKKKTAGTRGGGGTRTGGGTRGGGGTRTGGGTRGGGGTRTGGGTRK